MLDIKFIREHADLVAEAARKKRLKLDVAELLAADDDRRKLLQDVEELRNKVNSASQAIGAMDDTPARRMLIEEMRQVKEAHMVKEATLKKAEDKYMSLMFDVPNIPDPSVPEGDSDADNQEIRKVGQIPEFSFIVKDHFTLMKELDLVDTERGAKVSGTRGYFLKGDAVLIEMALWRFALEELSKKGFTIVRAPSIVRGLNLIGSGHFPQAQEDVYQVENDEYLAGTSEIPLMGYHSGEILSESELPKKYVAISPCFRKEAGSYGKDTKGLYRVHEFYKIEQLVLIKNDHQESVEWHEMLTANAEELLQKIGIPYRVVVNSTGDIGRAHVKTYDIESWVPSEQRYRETHSSSYYHAFQTRRLNLRYRDSDGKIHFAHSLNSTVVATPRLLIPLIENNQEADGSIRIPEVLRPYVGKERVTKKG